MLDEAPRLILGVLLGVTLALIGFPLGVALGGIYLVPLGSGLAGPTIALSYGLVAVVITSVLSVVLAMYLPRPTLLAAAYMSLGGAFVAVLGVGVRWLQLQRHEQQALTASPGDTAFRLEMQVADAVSNRVFRSISIDAGERTVRVVSVADSRRCRSPLASDQYQGLLEVLQPVDRLLSEGADLCPDMTAVEYTLEWTFQGAKAASPPARLQLSGECLSSRLALGKLVGAVNRIWLSADRPRCE